MKNVIRLSLAILGCTLLFASVQAQNNLNKTYTWDNETDEVTLTMNVEPGTKVLAMSFVGTAKKGNMVVTAFDPNGNSECGFCLVTDCALSCGKARGKEKVGQSVENRKSKVSSCISNTEDGVTKTTMSCSRNGYSYTSSSTEGDFGAKGNANEVISDPEPGEWTFVIEAMKVTGDLVLSIKQD